MTDDMDFLRQAYKIAAMYSTDPSTNTGVVVVKNDIILVSDANHEAPGIELTDERKERPLKYEVIEHAERNAIAYAAQNGIALKGSTMYSPWFPCAPCARMIIGAGIEELVGHADMDDTATKFNGNAEIDPKSWDYSQFVAKEMLEEAGVRYRGIEGKVGDVKILVRGEWYEP